MDWNNVVWDSAAWLLKAYVMTAVVFVVVIVLLARFTKWGRQFWRFAAPYFDPRRSPKPLAILAFLLLFTVFAVRMNVLFSYWSNDFYDSIQNLDETAFWHFLRVFAILAAVHVVRALIDFLIGQTLDIDWRVWLTHHLTDDWLDSRAYYRDRFLDDAIDNPDQRIQADITNFVTTARVLSMGAVTAVLSIVSFTGILWDLSGPMTVFGTEIPRAMIFLVFVYVLVTTLVAFWIGKPLIKLNFLNEKLGANFRYALIRVREYGESIAFYRGENVERRTLAGRFAAVIRNMWHIVFRTLKFNGWNLSVNQTAVIFPFLIQGPRLFSGQVSLGDVMQTSTAFSQVHDSLSFFRESYDDFASFRATLIRLNGLANDNMHAAALPILKTGKAGNDLDVEKLDVRTPSGSILIEALDLTVGPGQSLLVKGPSGSGKTTLLRTLADLWPYADGTVSRPSGEAIFLSQRPYLPLGSLRTALAYPSEPTADDGTLREALSKVALGNLADRLDETADWTRILSPGEQQRLAFARVLTAQPAVVFLDEATSAIDEGLEHTLYTLLRSELPDSIVVSVGHRSTLDQFHSLGVELEGEGRWAESSLVG
ncbi:ABC transporter ATP-binding protein/permease [Rhodococcus tibetensis]|uniref:ABC transporter ATP-binding protein/permease n=1 Tax=Rhodococcus tibetensis TaxID=2965064 RepID=A0ABT1QA34_9NOCA|nr:ABC transporter ATP-binding protein/permease [Rhodococcus sp. FXJ9.536]MCQ4119139.1 ABC transporter ATP-binding protein/permease [Rhodococcus sp. FXJ9.536]